MRGKGNRGNCFFRKMTLNVCYFMWTYKQHNNLYHLCTLNLTRYKSIHLLRKRGHNEIKITWIVFHSCWTAIFPERIWEKVMFTGKNKYMKNPFRLLALQFHICAIILLESDDKFSPKIMYGRVQVIISLHCVYYLLHHGSFFVLFFLPMYLTLFRDDVKLNKGILPWLQLGLASVPCRLLSCLHCYQQTQIIVVMILLLPSESLKTISFERETFN